MTKQEIFNQNIKHVIAYIQSKGVDIKIDETKELTFGKSDFDAGKMTPSAWVYSMATGQKTEIYGKFKLVPKSH